MSLSGEHLRVVGAITKHVAVEDNSLYNISIIPREFIGKSSEFVFM